LLNQISIKMKSKFALSILLLLIFCTYNDLLAQEEIYDQPVKIIDTLNTNTQPKEEKIKVKAQKDAKTEIETKKEMLNRIRIGLSNFGFQFGTYTTLQATPTISFMVIPNRLEIGIGSVLAYYRIRYTSTFSESFFVYGADIFARGYVYKGAFLTAQYDLINKPSYYDAYKKVNVHHLLLGAGYAQKLGKIGYFNASLLFNVLNGNESFYRGTFGNFPMVISLGFTFGLGGKD